MNRRFWIQAMMEDVAKNGVLAVQTLTNNIMASTVLASTAIMLSSLIAVLMSSAGANAWFDFGDRSAHAFSIKFFSILVFFLVAFLLNLQSIRYYSHASILINVPFKKMSTNHHHHHYLVTVECVMRMVNRGSSSWSLGLRAFYFFFPLFFWIFGPIPMILCCFLLVFMLYFLDVTFELGWSVGVSDDDDDDDHKNEERGDTLPV